MKNKKFQKLKNAVVATTLAVLLAFPSVLQPVSVQAAQQIKVTAVDVGQGNAFLVEDNGENTLVDTGLEKEYENLQAFLEKENISKIDNLVITHPDADHMGGADLVIKDYDVQKFYTTDYTSTTKEYREMMQAAEEKGLTPQYVKEKDKLSLGSGITADVLSPESGTKADDSNASSVVLSLKYGKKRFLMMGDAPSKVENRINADYNIKTDVLFVSHHGSNSASGVLFLKEAAPEYAVISVGEDNSYGHPHKEVLNRLGLYAKHTLRTDNNGSITFTTDGSTLKATYTGEAAKAQKPDLNKTSLSLQPGQNYTLYVKGIDSDAVKWSSSNKNVTVNAKGKLTAKKTGSAKITAKVGNQSVTCKVKVKKMTLNKYKLTLKKGKTYTLHCSAQNVKWSSSSKSIATVSNKGKVKAKKAGTVTITAKAGSEKVKCKVTVTAPAPKPQPSTPAPQPTTPAPQPTPAPTTPTATTGSIIGNVNSHKYHTHDCGHLPLEKNRVYFNNSAEAEAQGYTICGFCDR